MMSHRSLRVSTKTLGGCFCLLAILSNGSVARASPTNSIFDYGLVSYGEIYFNGSVAINGNNSSVFVVDGGQLGDLGTPVAVNVPSSIGGDLYWATPVPAVGINWGSLTIAAATNAPGYLPSDPQFLNHVHANQPAPTAPTFDSTPFLPYVGAAAGYGGRTLAPGSYPNLLTITNGILNAGNYIFNNALTIDGILYLEPGANVNFNAGVTINGCIVQDVADSSSNNPSSVRFNGTVTQTSIANLSGPDFPVGETALAGTSMLLPDDNVIFNNTLSAVGSVITGDLTINDEANINGGSLISLSPENTSLFGTLTINIPEPSAIFLAGLGAMTLLLRR